MSLASQQVERYTNDGYLVVAELIDRGIVERAHNVLLAQIPNGHSNPYHAFVNHSAVLACFDKEVCSAAAELAGVRKGFKPPTTAYTVSVFPSAESWNWPPPHIDHAHAEDGHQTFPPPFRVACLIYLNDVQSKSGGTVVWPGSHRRLAEMAAADPARYKYLASVYRGISNLNLGNPVEISARAGDVLFYQYLCAHSGSSNNGPIPRLALNHKW